MKIITGDLIKLANGGEFDVIVHGCNCFCAMGAGIAKAIKQAWPEVYEADLKTKKGDRSKLGTNSTAIVHNKYSDILFIVNAYTQYHYGLGLQVDYNAIKQCFRAVRRDFTNIKIGYPMIGAGLAGGDWNIISKIIDEELEGCDHALVVLPK